MLGGRLLTAVMHMHARRKEAEWYTKLVSLPLGDDVAGPSSSPRVDFMSPMVHPRLGNLLDLKYDDSSQSEAEVDDLSVDTQEDEPV